MKIKQINKNQVVYVNMNQWVTYHSQFTAVKTIALAHLLKFGFLE